MPCGCVQACGWASMSWCAHRDADCGAALRAPQPVILTIGFSHGLNNGRGCANATLEGPQLGRDETLGRAEGTHQGIHRSSRRRVAADGAQAAVPCDMLRPTPRPEHASIGARRWGPNLTLSNAAAAQAGHRSGELRALSVLEAGSLAASGLSLQKKPSRWIPRPAFRGRPSLHPRGLRGIGTLSSLRAVGCSRY